MDLVRQMYDGNASKIRIPAGDTAYIEQRRGLAQGDSLSCAMANLCVGALVRFIQATYHIHIGIRLNKKILLFPGDSGVQLCVVWGNG